MHYLSRLSAVVSLAACPYASVLAGDTVLIEAESFRDRGGWSIDTQAMEQMGAPYMLAHRLGEPVQDAVTTVNLPSPGKYRIVVRTRD